MKFSGNGDDLNANDAGRLSSHICLSTTTFHSTPLQIHRLNTIALKSRLEHAAMPTSSEIRLDMLTLQWSSDRP